MVVVGLDLLFPPDLNLYFQERDEGLRGKKEGRRKEGRRDKEGIKKKG